MESDPGRLALSERLTLPADALVLSVVAAAALTVAKSLANIPTPGLDPMSGFIINMTIASILGASSAWLIHRHACGANGTSALGIGLAVSVTVVLILENAMIAVGDTAPEVVIIALTVYQVMGAVAVSALLVACAVELARRTDTRRRHIGLTRLAGLATIVALIVFQSIPGTQADMHLAQMFAVLGLTTVTGAVGVAIGDVILARWHVCGVFRRPAVDPDTQA